MNFLKSSTPETWFKLPWLTVAAVFAVFSALFILMLTLAFWQLPHWRQNLHPVAQHVIQTQLPVLQHFPEERWHTRTPLRVSSNTAKLPRYVAHASPFVLAPDLPKIAIVIDDVGVAEDLSQKMIEAMPKEVTLSFLPYGEGTRMLSQLARMKGHEIMVHLPMQPISQANPGPQALFLEDSDDVIHDKISQNIRFLKHIAVGVNNHMGSAITADQHKMTLVLNDLQQEGFFFLDSITTPQPASQLLKSKYTLPILRRNIFLDHYIDAEHIHEYLEKTEAYAKKHGGAIAIGHPHNLTREALQAWIPTLQEKGLQLVPITAFLSNK